MIFLYSISLYYAIVYLRKPSAEADRRSAEFANVGMAFGILGILTGMLWAKYTWGSYWHGDPKQNGAAITLLVYFAYFVLRGSLDNEEQRARLSAVYNIFAYAAMVPLIFIIPRMTSSMHPGSGGNPGFSTYDDLDYRMWAVFYAAIIAWILVGLWIATLRVRIKTLEEKIADIDDAKAH
jgi:heme exporter protein C